RICDRALHQAFAARSLTNDADCVRSAIGESLRGSIAPAAAAETPAARPADRPAVKLPANIKTLLDGELSALTNFAAESAAPVRSRRPNKRPAAKFGWMTAAVAGAAVAVLAVAAAVGAPDLLTQEPPA